MLKYRFDPPGVSSAVTENTFDDFKRLVGKKYTLGGNVIDRSYDYNNSRVIKCVDKSTVYYIGTNDYTYDTMGRIKTDSYSGKYAPGNYRTYEYDEYGQLKRENNQGLAKTYMYEYNDIGNLTAIKEYALSLSTTPAGTPVTTTFGYTDDRLTSFGGTTISNNAMGCPTSYDGKTATWSKGKLSRLSQGTKLTGMSTYNYGYNGYCQRISRSYSYAAGTSGSGAAQLGQLIASSRKYYYDHAGRLIAEDVTKTYYGEGTTTENIVFLYDESGIIGMELTTGGATNLYYFQRNLQGDVVSIYDPNGTLKAHYIYDAWGNCTISGETTSYDVANANPIRYRGYYYDDDTGLYYCNARYYSPKWRRFISPDDTAYLDPESVNGLNLYCYCNNDPVNYADPSGHSVMVCIRIAAGIGAALGGGFEIAKQISVSGWNPFDWNWQKIGLAAAGGASAGAISAIPIPGSGVLSYLGTFALGGVASVAGGLISGSVSSWGTAAFAFALGGVANVVGRGISELVKHLKVSHRIDAIASEANTIANMSAKQKSLTIWNMIGMDNFSRNAYKGWGYEQIFNLLMTEATNVSAIHATNNLMRYGIYSAIVSSAMSGWY